jgi:hypothetical protein
MTDFALPAKCGALAMSGLDASAVLSLEKRLHPSNNEPNAIIPMPVLHCFKKCLLVSNFNAACFASICIFSLNIVLFSFW